MTMVLDRIREPQGRAEPRYVGDIARPISVLNPRMPVGEFELMYRDQELTAVAVEDLQNDRIGLITGTQFARAMTGRLGYGRPVFLRKSIGELANWQPLVLPAQTAIAQAATQAMQRSGENRYEHVLIADTLWKVAEAADLTLSLVTAIARKSSKDSVTSLPVRAATWHELDRRCIKATRGKARIVLMLIGIDGISEVNSKYGQQSGDSVIRKVAERLSAALQPGAFLGRVTGRQFAVITTISDDDEITTAARVELVTQHYLSSIRVPDASMPAEVWPSPAIGAAWTGSSLSHPDVLIRIAGGRLRTARALPI